ncbi:unnamed protein product [Brassica oleracea var. botrytis]
MELKVSQVSSSRRIRVTWNEEVARKGTRAHCMLDHEEATRKEGENTCHRNVTQLLLSGSTEAWLVSFLRKHQKDLSFCFGCAHNPTGTDPTPEQWAKIADVIQEKNHIPFFDVAYQGFASGSLDEDATSVRLYAERGMEFFVAQSYSKNLGLYAERIGAINVVCSSADAATRVRSQLKRICSAYVLESTGSWGEDCGKCSGRFNYVW